MPKSFLPTFKYLHSHDRDWRVFQVGHLGYDSYDEESMEEGSNQYTDEDNVILSDNEEYGGTSDDEQRDLDDEDGNETGKKKTQKGDSQHQSSSTSTSFISKLLRVSLSSSTPPSTSQRPQNETLAPPPVTARNSRYITQSNRKRRNYHKWIEIKWLRDKPIKQISAGGYHLVVLMEDGSVYSWGWGKLGQLGQGDILNRLKPMKINIPMLDEIQFSSVPNPEPEPKTDEIAPPPSASTNPTPRISLTSSLSSLTSSSLTSSSSFESHTMNHTNSHQGTEVPLSNPFPTSLTRTETKSIKKTIPRIVKVKSGGRHSILLNNDGRVFTFGCAEDGRLGHGDRLDSLTPKEITSLRGYRVTLIESGFWHSILATNCKKVFIFGHGEEGKLGLGHTQSQLLPTEIKELRDRGIRSASGGAWHTILLTDDQHVYTCGSHYWGQLGVGGLLKDENMLQKMSKKQGFPIVVPQSKDACYSPVEVVELRNKDIVKVVAGSNFNVCLSGSGLVYTFGCGSSGKTGHGGNITSFTPRLVQSVSHLKVKDICTGSNHTLLLTDDGKVFSFGWCRYGQLGHGNFEEQDKPKEIEALQGINISQFTAGAFFTVVATRNPQSYEKGSFLDYHKKKNHFSDVFFVD